MVKINFKKVSMMAMIMIMGISAIMISIDGNEVEQDSRAMNNGMIQYAHFSTSGLGSYSYNNIASFSIRVYNDYSGEHWIGDEYVYSHDNLYNTKLTIMTNQVTDIDGNPASFIIEPTDTTSMMAYNGMDDGYMISSSRTYYRNADNSPFTFIVKTTGVKSGSYRIPVKIDAKVQVDYVESSPGEYDWRTISQSGFIQFTAHSYINGIGDAIQLNGFEKFNCPIYSGAEYLTIRSPTISSIYTPLTDVNIILTLPDLYFVLSQDYISIEQLSYYTNMEWKVDVMKDTPPGSYKGSLSLNYYEGSVYISEGPYEVNIDVVPTPLLMGPYTMEMTVPTLVIDQKTTAETFSIDLVNDGNVEISSAMIRLDLDSSYFLKQKQFYYDEDSSSQMIYPSLEVIATDIAIGQTFTVTFPSVSIFKMLPPGDYLIPIDYRISYKDPNSVSGFRVDSYQWDEIGIQDYMDIMWYRQDPRPTELMKPHFMLRVMDDTEGLDLTLKCDTIVSTGVKNLPVIFTLENSELYSLTDTSIEIWSSDASKVWNPSSTSGPGLLSVKEGVTVPGSTISQISTYNMVGQLNVAKNAGSGPFEIYVLVEGMDNKMQTVQVNISSTIQIKAQPGRLEVSGLQTSKVIPGRSFELSITLINTGDVALTDYEVMISCKDNMISVTETSMAGGILQPGDSAVILFNCKANDCMDYEMGSDIMVLTSTNDQEGNQMEFSDGGGSPVSIIAAREPQELSTESAIKDVGFYFFLSIVLAALIISIAVVISVAMVLVVRMKMNKEEKVDKKETGPALPDKKAETLNIETVNKPEPSLQPAIQETPQQVIPDAPAPQQIAEDKPAPQPVRSFPPAQTPVEPQPAPANKPVQGESGLDDIFSGDASKVDDLFN